MVICGCCGSALTERETKPKLYAFSKFDLVLLSAGVACLGAAAAILIQFFAASYLPVVHHSVHRERGAYVIAQALARQPSIGFILTAVD